MGRRKLRPLVGSPDDARFRRPGSGMEERDASAFSTPRAGSGGEAASLSPPARPAGTHRPKGRGSLTVSAPLPRCRPRRVRRPHTPETRPLPPRPVPASPPARLGSQAAAARAGHGPMDQPAESFLRGKRRGGAGRGGGRRGGKGPGEEGERSERLGGGGARPAGPSALPQETAGEAGGRVPPPSY